MGPEPSDSKGERRLIRRIRQLGRDTSAEGAAPADDMAELPVFAGQVLWSSDMLMDGVDFRSAEHDWRSIGHKAMAVNLSDCAAMAARPLGALCAVSLSNAMSMEDALELHRGVAEMGAEYECPLLGGDTNSWDHPTVICVTVAARVPAGRRAVGRGGARPGDLICLTGPVGGSILGRHMSPRPRVEESLEIARQAAPTSMIDVSDGLAVDLEHICTESGCGAILDRAAVESCVHPDAKRLSQQTGTPAVEHALFDGEDFELIVTVASGTPPETLRRVGLAPIGVMAESPGIRMRAADGSVAAIEVKGWEHFR